MSNEISQFFIDNNVNFFNFCEFFSFVKTNVHSKNSKTNFVFGLITCDKYKIISRNPISKYQTVVEKETFFFVVELDNNQNNEFGVDVDLALDTENEMLCEEVEELFQTKLNDYVRRLLFYNYYLPEELDVRKNMFYKNEKQNKIELVDGAFNLKIVKNFFIVTRILPEHVQLGLLLVLDNTIEFHPVLNDYKSKHSSFAFNRIHRCLPYRYLMKRQGVQIFLYKSQRSKLFSFESVDKYEEFYNIVYEKAHNIDNLYLNIAHQQKMWVEGQISNYDYLLYLNFMASRSFSDLSQYPVFPWIIANYSKKPEFEENKTFRDLRTPIGALSLEKLESFKDKLNDNNLEDSKELPYLYGKHYSTPSDVMYFLVRSHPHYFLRLQNGNFGPADRLFNSIENCWDYLLQENSDVKELVPEFFNSELLYLLIKTADIVYMPELQTNNKTLRFQNWFFCKTICPPYQQHLQRQSYNCHPQPGIIFIHIVQHHLNISRENGDQQQDDQPGSHFSGSGKQQH